MPPEASAAVCCKTGPPGEVTPHLADRSNLTFTCTADKHSLLGKNIFLIHCTLVFCFGFLANVALKSDTSASLLLVLSYVCLKKTPLASPLLSRSQTDEARHASSCLQKDKMREHCAGTSTPDFLFSELSVMFSRSPKRSLVMNWCRVGTMPVCLLEAVSASSCSRFSRRCSSNIFCEETTMDWLATPDMALGSSFMHAMHFRAIYVQIVEV